MVLICNYPNSSLARGIASYSSESIYPLCIEDYPDREFALPLLPDIHSPINILWQFSLPHLHRQLWQLCDVLVQLAGPKRLIIPYLPYSRANPPHHSVLGIFFDILKKSNVQNILTVDIHQPIPWPVHSISPFQPINAIIHQQGFDNPPILIAPDHGGYSRVKELAATLKLPWLALDKRAPSPQALPEVERQHCLIIDDILATGHTLDHTITTLSRHRARTITAIITHDLGLAPARRVLDTPNLRAVYMSNSLDPSRTKEGKEHFFSLAQPIAEKIKIYAKKTGKKFKNKAKYQTN